MLDDAHLQFARQCGATHVIVHLCDYGDKGDRSAAQPTGDENGWGIADHPGLWELEALLQIKRKIESHGLLWYGVENFDPAQWHDILLDGPLRDQQLEQAKAQIRIFGQLGLKAFGYNFSLSGVTGRASLTTRGGAETVGLDGINAMLLPPVPDGMVWNMRYRGGEAGVCLPEITEDTLWSRVGHFLRELAPVAEAAGVALSAHPDDPPLSVVRRQPKLIYKPEYFQRLIDLNPSPANQLELCLGTLAEMEGAGGEAFYRTVEELVRQKRVGYIHMRNVVGTVPHYTETFIDDGRIDVRRVFQILADHGYDGVIIPDHAPSMTAPGPWHAGMAFAMGYLKANLQAALTDNNK